MSFHPGAELKERRHRFTRLTEAVTPHTPSVAARHPQTLPGYVISLRKPS